MAAVTAVAVATAAGAVAAASTGHGRPPPPLQHGRTPRHRTTTPPPSPVNLREPCLRQPRWRRPTALSRLCVSPAGSGLSKSTTCLSTGGSTPARGRSNAMCRGAGGRFCGRAVLPATRRCTHGRGGWGGWGGWPVRRPAPRVVGLAASAAGGRCCKGEVVPRRPGRGVTALRAAVTGISAVVVAAAMAAVAAVAVVAVAMTTVGASPLFRHFGGPRPPQCIRCSPWRR